MKYSKYWDAAKVRRVFSTESRQKARDLFLQTHQPFCQIRVDFCKEANGERKFITEQELREIVHGGSLDADNRLFFIVGEAGSGKSELCQWLEYMADKQVCLPIHIPRSMTSAAHVAFLLHQQLETDTSRSLLAHSPIATQARYIALSAVVLLYERNTSVLTPASTWEQFLTSEQVIGAIRIYLQRHTVEQEHQMLSLLPDQQIKELCISLSIEIEESHLKDIGTTIRKLLERALEQTLWMTDLRRLLHELSNRAIAQGRRPLLLLEDITAFQLLGDLLLDYLLDLTSGHFDAVIGVTTGFEQTQLARATLEGDLTHIHHRLRARFVLSDAQGRSYGLEENLTAFTRSYLQAIQLPISDPIDLEKRDYVFGAGLYPLTETALHRAFQSLCEEGNPRQTPRLFLEHILGASLLASEIPPLTLDRSPYVQPPPILFRTDEVADDRLQSLLRWYGQVAGDVVTLDRRIADFWEIPVPESLCYAGQLRVARTYLTLQPDVPTVNVQWEQELRELQRWLTDGSLYPSRETLKRGIERVLLQLGDPRVLSSPDSLGLAHAEIYYARGDERLPIFLDGNSGDQPSGGTTIKIRITRTPEERTLLEEIAYLALSDQELSQICQNLAITLEWARQHWNAYHDEVRALLSEHLGGLPVEQVILIAWRLICALRGMNSSEYLRTQLPSADNQPYASSSPWVRSPYSACYTAGEALVSWQETVRRLVIGAFTLRETLVDQERYSVVAAALDTETLLSKIARLSLKSLRSLPYKIRPGSQPLYELLVPLQRYAHALLQINTIQAFQADIADLERRMVQLKPQLTIDLDHLSKQLDLLRQSAGDVGVPWQASWVTTLETASAANREHLQYLYAGLGNLYNEAREIVAAGESDIWVYQDFRQRLKPILLNPYWQFAATIQTIQEELVRGARQRYRHDAKVLTGTRSYHELLEAIRAVRQELIYGKSNTI